MTRWGDLERDEPELAAAGRSLLHTYGLGLGFLATVRKDGGPRVHPVCPVLAAGGLWVFIGKGSPKCQDLHCDGRYALHSFPLADVDDEFYVAGVSRLELDEQTQRVVHDVHRATGALTTDDDLFELHPDRALLARYGPRPSWPPTYTRWRA